MMLPHMTVRTVVLVGLIAMHKTGCSGKTRLVLHVHSSSRACLDHVWVSQQIETMLQVWMPDEPKTTSRSARCESMRWKDTPSWPACSTSSSAAAVLAPHDSHSHSPSTSGRQAGTRAGAHQGAPAPPSSLPCLP